MIGRTNTGGGGGGGLSPNSAVIHVTAPVGSTISFSKSGVVAKVLGPEKSHINSADASLADWYYSVKDANYGSWRITATLDTDEAYSDVSVTTNAQYDVALSYSLYIVRSGVVETEPQKTGGTITSYSGYTKWQLSRTVALLYLEVGSVTSYDKITLTVSGGLSWKGGQTPGVGISSSVPTIDGSNGNVNPYSGFTALNNSSGGISSGTYEVDVSGISGSAVVWISLAYSNSISSPYVDIVNWYLD